MKAPEPVGELLEDGTEVSLVVPYRKGTESRYRVTTVLRSEDRRSGNSGGKRVIYEASVGVTEGDGSGPARVKLVPEAFDMTMLLGTDPAGNTVGWRFDSRSPDERLLASDPQIAAAIKPELATLGRPVEIRIDARGRAVGVEGADDWRDRFLAEIERVDPKFASEAANAPTAELVAETWGNHLFPALGGGTLKAGDVRKLVVREDSFSKGSVLHVLRAKVTHAGPDVLRVEAVGTPEWEPRMGAARNSYESAIVKCHVQASTDSSRFVWHIDTANGRLLEAFHQVDYQHWVSFGEEGGRRGEPIAAPTFTRIERWESVVLIEDEEEEEAGSAKEKEEASADPSDGTESARADQPK